MVLTGAGHAVRDARIGGGVRLLFTYRSRWPLFTFDRNGASWFVSSLFLTESLLMGQISR